MSSNANIPSLNKIEIEVYADDNGSGGVTWSHSIKTNGNDDHGKIKLNHGIGSKLHFDLHDRSGLGVRFDASGPFFVAEGSGGSCPSSMASAQCMVDSCDADGLVVIDWNYGTNCELHYQLNFVTEAGELVNPYDPVIQNTGGGIKPAMIA